MFGNVARKAFAGEKALFDAHTDQPLTFTGCVPALYNSTYSSLAPGPEPGPGAVVGCGDGPRKRSSLITMPVACCADKVSNNGAIWEESATAAANNQDRDLMTNLVSYETVGGATKSVLGKAVPTVEAGNC